MGLVGRTTLLRGAVALCFCLSALPALAQTGGITGQAKNDKGEMYVGNPILIERQEVKGVYKTKTDKHGKYIFIGLPLGTYKVTLQDQNGGTIFHITQHVGMGDPTEINFDLAKEKAAAQRDQQSNPEVQKKLEEEAKEMKQSAGLKQLFDQGNELYNQKKYAEAAAMYEQAVPLAKEKNLPIVLARLGDSYHKARNYDKAVESYQKGLQASPSDFTMHNNMGTVLADMGKIPEAMAEFQKAAEADPANASHAYFNLGAVLYNKGKTEEAAEAFKKARTTDPNYADAYFLEAQALMGKATMSSDGKVVPAPGTVEALQSYLKLDPSGKHANEAQAMLQSMQGQIQTEFKKEKKKKG